MSSTDDSANDEEQLTTGPTDYRALLAMTRPMAMAEHTPPSLPGQEISGSGSEIPPEPADQRAARSYKRRRPGNEKRRGGHDFCAGS